MFEFMKFRFSTPQEATDAFAWLIDLQGRPEPQDLVYWAVATSDDECFVGWAGLGRTPADRSAELGWFLLPAYWGRGYATEATGLLLRYGVDALGSERMVATCDPENIGSKRVLEKAGMTCEGLLAEPVDTWRGPRPRLRYTRSGEEERP